tara:strand:- start:93 stop:566 length:474 start_codon:yes stop_codon:yes gene_type:complete
MKLTTVKQRNPAQEASLLGANVVHGLTRCLLMADLKFGMAARADEHLTHGVTQAKGGVQIHNESGGNGSPALVFIHGWNCECGYWSAQLPVSATTNQVVAIDLAGHGDSGVNRENWAMVKFGADVAAVAQALRLEDIVLVSHSMDGQIAAADCVTKR